MLFHNFFNNFFKNWNSLRKKTSSDNIKDKELSVHEIYDILCKSWNTLDVSLLTPLLSDSFHYESFNVGRAINDKNEYVKYISGKFKTLSKSPESKVTAEIKTENGTERPFLCQNNVNAVLEIKIENGLITKMLMRPPFSKFRFENFDKDFPELYNIAGKTLDEYFHKESSEQWGWIQTTIPQIRFQDLCISYGKYILCIIVGLYRKTLDNGEETCLNNKEYENLLRECKKNNLTPCLFLIDSEGNPVIDGCHLIDARTFSELELNSLAEDNNTIMSEWEINNLGIACVCDYMKKQGYSIINYCDVVGIEPQIWFKLNDEIAYILVRSIPAGLFENKYIINKNELNRFSMYKGFFVDVRWNILEGNNGEFLDRTLQRGAGLIHNDLSLIEIDQAIKNLDFIQVVDKESFIVQDNR